MIYVKLILAALALWFAYHQGGLAGAAKVSALELAQQAAVSKAVEAQAASTARETARLNTLVASYESTPINPVALDIGSRVYKYTTASCDAVPKAPANPTGTSAPATQPSDIA